MLYVKILAAMKNSRNVIKYIDCVFFFADRAQHKTKRHEIYVGHLSVAMTAESAGDVTHTTGANVVVTTPSQSYGSGFYFQCAVVIVGVAGAVANALILYALVVSKQHKKQVLIFNQNLCDFFSSLLLTVTYAIKLCNIYLAGLGGYLFCVLVVSENLVWCVILASKANIVFVTIERYLRAVYPVWSKNALRRWMTHSAAAFAWISGFVHITALTFSTSDVVDGVCYAYVMWESRAAQAAYGVWYFVAYYAVELFVFVFCYGHILVAVRRQAKVMAGHSRLALGSRASSAQSSRIQTSVVRTMILVSALYTVSDLPGNVYYLMMNIHADGTLLENGYYASMFISFLYFCSLAASRERSWPERATPK